MEIILLLVVLVVVPWVAGYTLGWLHCSYRVKHPKRPKSQRLHRTYQSS